MRRYQPPAGQLSFYDMLVQTEAAKKPDAPAFLVPLAARAYAPKYYRYTRQGITYGMTVPMPTDAHGHEFVKGPYKVYQRTDGLYCIMDNRLTIGDQVIHVDSNLQSTLERFSTLEWEPNHEQQQ
jgi:hypothetical protein